MIVRNFGGGPHIMLFTFDLTEADNQIYTNSIRKPEEENLPIREIVPLEMIRLNLKCNLKTTYLDSLLLV
jgi:hypothetical protein